MAHGYRHHDGIAYWENLRDHEGYFVRDEGDEERIPQKARSHRERAENGSALGMVGNSLNREVGGSLPSDRGSAGDSLHDGISRKSVGSVFSLRALIANTVNCETPQHALLAVIILGCVVALSAHYVSKIIPAAVAG